MSSSPLLYAGCVLPEYKHFYLIGTQQVRYGIGPLLTPSSKLVAKMIELQDQMELPIGLVMKESGAPLPDTHLVDPIRALRQMRIAKYTLPWLLRKERRLRKKKIKSRQHGLATEFRPGRAGLLIASGVEGSGVPRTCQNRLRRATSSQRRYKRCPCGFRFRGVPPLRRWF